MTRKDFEILARWVSQYGQEIVEGLAGHLQANYPNFNYDKFMAYVDKIRLGR